MAFSLVTTADGNLGVMSKFVAASGDYARRLGAKIELIIVDDLGVLPDEVKDGWTVIEGLVVVCLTPQRRRGQLLAVLEGIARARAGAVLTMDPDMPGNIPDIETFMQRYRDGMDTVYGWRYRRDGLPVSRLVMSRLFNFLARSISAVPVHDINTPMVLLSRRGVEYVSAGMSKGLYPKLYLPFRFGKTFCEVRIETDELCGKRSNYSYLALVRLFWADLRAIWRFRRQVTAAHLNQK